MTATEATVRLAPEPASAGRARRFLREVLTAADRVELLAAAELACTELVTNAVLHAHTPMDLTVHVDRHVRVQVRDFNPTPPVQRHYDVQASTGRGMALVAAVADAYGVSDVGPDGKTVWFAVGGGRTEGGEPTWDPPAPDAAAPCVPAAGEHTLRLLGMPPTLWLAARQHHDAVLRELAFYCAGRDTTGTGIDLAATDRARSTVSNAVMATVDEARRGGTAGPAVVEGYPSPLPWVPEPFDLELRVPADLGPAAAAMQDTLDAAEHLARTGRLLSRPGLPEIVAVRDWACEQVVAQLAGAPPSRWPGTDQERFVQDVDRGRGSHLEAFVAAVRESDRRVVAADDANRIVAVAAPLARLLGWQADELVGRRIIALIPHGCARRTSRGSPAT